jgi:glutamyl-tRNA synthetase
MLTRLAPTPSGYLHKGNAFSFLLTERYAQQTGSKILLRIDDMDTERKRPEYVQDIFDSLHWLGIEWHTGPKDAADFEDNWSQRYRLPLYNAAIKKLVAENKVYACSCSRKQIREKRHCDCESKKIPVNMPDTSLRMQVKRSTGENDSFIIRRRDGLPAYQLFSLIDDLHFRVTAIIRGEDLLDSTAMQHSLALQLGEDAFSGIKFIHHPLLTDENGHKLSKSESALSLKAMRENGMKANELRSHFAAWCSDNHF